MLRINSMLVCGIFVMAGCSGGPSGEVGSKEWCEDVMEMPAQEQADTLTIDELLEVASCMIERETSRMEKSRLERESSKQQKEAENKRQQQADPMLGLPEKEQPKSNSGEFQFEYETF